MNKILSQITTKIKADGYRRSTAEALHIIANKLNNTGELNFIGHQHIAHRNLSKYMTFKNKHILEIGGDSSCQSARPFLADGAAQIVVTGLGHIAKEQRGTITVMRADALALSQFFEPCSFDAVYGLSVIEHIRNPKLLLQELHRVLKPNGLAFLEGRAIWSSAKGHHLWIDTGRNSPFRGMATANYFFCPVQNKKSTNPLPDWSHIIYNPDEMAAYLQTKGIPSIDIECIIQWTYHRDEINRLGMTEISEAYTTASFAVLQAETAHIGVPRDIKRKLIEKFGYGIDFSCEGVKYILKKC